MKERNLKPNAYADATFEDINTIIDDFDFRTKRLESEQDLKILYRSLQESEVNLFHNVSKLHISPNEQKVVFIILALINKYVTENKSYYYEYMFLIRYIFSPSQYETDLRKKISVCSVSDQTKDFLSHTLWGMKTESPL